jgi:hypothetical protein
MTGIELVRDTCVISNKLVRLITLESITGLSRREIFCFCIGICVFRHCSQRAGSKSSIKLLRLYKVSFEQADESRPLMLLQV